MAAKAIAARATCWGTAMGASWAMARASKVYGLATCTRLCLRRLTRPGAGKAATCHDHSWETLVNSTRLNQTSFNQVKSCKPPHHQKNLDIFTQENTSPYLPRLLFLPLLAEHCRNGSVCIHHLWSNLLASERKLYKESIAPSCAAVAGVFANSARASVASLPRARSDRDPHDSHDLQHPHDSHDPHDPQHPHDSHDPHDPQDPHDSHDPHDPQDPHDSDDPHDQRRRPFRGRGVSGVSGSGSGAAAASLHWSALPTRDNTGILDQNWQMAEVSV